MLFLQLLQISLSLGKIILLFCFVIQSYKIPLLKVEAVQFLAGYLSIHDILVDDEAGSFCVVGSALSYLTDGSVIAKQVEQLFGCYIVVEVLDEECPGHEHEYWHYAKLDGNAYRLTSGASFPPLLILIRRQIIAQI